MTTTTNYGLIKDDINEFYDVLRVNTNLDKIDTAIAENKNNIKSKFDANSEIEFVEAAVDTDIVTKDTLPTLWGKTLKRFNTIKVNIGTLTSLTTVVKTSIVSAINELVANISNISNNIGILSNLLTSDKTNLVVAINELVNGKFDKNNIVQTDTVSDSTKVPSAAVTNALGLEVDALNNNLASNVNANVMATADIIKVLSVTNGTIYTDGIYYYKKGTRVHLHISVSNLTPNALPVSLFTLPQYYRPYTKAINAVENGLTTANTNPGIIEVADTGLVMVMSGSAYCMGDISFDAFK